MIDITALALRMKAAAKQSAFSSRHSVGMEVAADSFGFIELTTPANVLALVEALEMAQRQIQAHERAEFTWLNALALPDDASRIDILPAIHAEKYALREATKRISSLESRTVTVKLPDEVLRLAQAPQHLSKHDQLCWMTGANWMRMEVVKLNPAAGIQVIEGEQKNG